MNVLVTGAAGYIGSVVTEELIKNGNFVIAVDNLERGHRTAIHPDAMFVLADILDADGLDQIFGKYHVDAVMHLAAKVEVNESMSNPEKYFLTNTVGGMNLLRIMLKHNVKKIIFSSTAAVYGNPAHVPVTEESLTIPANSYGETKLAFERILHWYSLAYGIDFITFRYFNAAGASANYGCDHKNETLLIPIVLQVALGQREYVPIFGVDYPTMDGTCVRDFIHVSDIANAHMLALEHLGCKSSKRFYNLGNGIGYSVLEIIKVAMQVTGADIRSKGQARRAGDQPIVIASSDLAKSELGWEPRYKDCSSIIESAWSWQKKHPYGYDQSQNEGGLQIFNTLK